MGTLMSIETCLNLGPVQYLMKNLLTDICGPRRRLTKIQATTRLEHLWPENWSRMSEAAQRKEKQQMGHRETEARQCAKVESHLFHWPDDKEFRETIQKSMRKKLELLVEAAMPCKVKNHKYTDICGKDSDTRKSKLACIVEAHESTRKGSDRALPKDHEGRIADKGFRSLSHFELVHKFIPMPRAMIIPGAKAAVDTAWEKLEKCRHGKWPM